MQKCFQRFPELYKDYDEQDDNKTEQERKGEAADDAVSTGVKGALNGDAVSEVVSEATGGSRQLASSSPTA